MTKQNIMATVKVVEDDTIRIELGIRIGEVDLSLDDAIKFGAAIIKKAEEAKAKKYRLTEEGNNGESISTQSAGH